MRAPLSGWRESNTQRFTSTSDALSVRYTVTKIQHEPNGFPPSVICHFWRQHLSQQWYACPDIFALFYWHPSLSNNFIPSLKRMPMLLTVFATHSIYLGSMNCTSWHSLRGPKTHYTSVFLFLGFLSYIVRTLHDSITLSAYNKPMVLGLPLALLLPISL